MDASQTTTAEETRSGGIMDLISQTNMIGNVIAAAASQKNPYEALPFLDSTLFQETYRKPLRPD